MKTKRIIVTTTGGSKVRVFVDKISSYYYTNDMTYLYVLEQGLLTIAETSEELDKLIDEAIPINTVYSPYNDRH